MPNVNYPVINVKVTFPGALPETMASSVALPLEKQFMAIPGLRIVSSNNTLGNTSIVLEFGIDKDMLEAKPGRRSKQARNQARLETITVWRPRP